MNSKEIENVFTVEKVEKKSGEFVNDEGKKIMFTNYWVHFKREDSPLIMRAKVDKVFNDYIEGDVDGVE